MLLFRPFAVVTPTVDGDVLAALAGADQWFTISQLRQLIGTYSYNGIKKATLRLAEQGIVIAETVGTTRTYRLNRDHLAAPAVIEVAHLREAFLQRLRDTLATWSTPPVYSSLFGSAARGDMRADSDIDLFLVRPDILDLSVEAIDPWREETARLQTEATICTGNDTRLLEMSESEVSEGLASGDSVLDVVRREGTVLTGSPGFWRRMRRG